MARKEKKSAPAEVLSGNDFKLDPPKVGRPAIYTEELALTVIDRLSSGESLRSICEEDEMPDKKTVLKWLATKPEFVAQYSRARELAVEAIAEDLFDISDDGRNDWMERLAFNGANPGWEVNGESINRSKLRVDTRKWYLSKIAPKKYGDNQKIDLTATVDTTVKAQATALAELPPELLQQVMEALEQKTVSKPED
jgi:hypothetical protein